MYGLLIGISLIIALFLIKFQAKRINIASNQLENLFLWIVVGGVLGGRIWHVLTEFAFYRSNLIDIFKIYNGGMSIIGAIVGGVVASWIVVKLFSNLYKITFGQILDLSIFGLPIAQAVGRLGNYFNQELYGYPTSLPWGIYISADKRLPHLSTFSYFHPLFFYEIIFTLGFGVLIWFFYHRPVHKFWELGRGILFLTYLEYYAVIRILLDIMRPDKSVVLGVGINQAVLLVFVFANGYILWKKWKKYAATTS